tara:strand:- start:724 stop:1215 length:492 start_codon:yes stop_codon:yes gene_type:complete
MEISRASYENPQPKKMKCFCCGSDQCFKENLNGEITIMCFECGFMTSEKYKKSNLEFQSQLSTTSKLVRELMKEDVESKLIWLPCVLTTKKGMIFPEGTIDNWTWTFAPLVKIEKEEQNKYLKPDGLPYEERLAIEKKQSFPKNRFMDACEAMGMVVDNSNKK